MESANKIFSSNDQEIESDVRFSKYIDSINYAIFFMGAASDDNFNENETRKHIFKLRELVEYLNKEKK